MSIFETIKRFEERFNLVFEENCPQTMAIILKAIAARDYSFLKEIEQQIEQLKESEYVL